MRAAVQFTPSQPGSAGIGMGPVLPDWDTPDPPLLEHRGETAAEAYGAGKVEERSRSRRAGTGRRLVAEPTCSYQEFSAGPARRAFQV